LEGSTGNGFKEKGTNLEFWGMRVSMHKDLCDTQAVNLNSQMLQFYIIKVRIYCFIFVFLCCLNIWF